MGNKRSTPNGLRFFSPTERARVCHTFSVSIGSRSGDRRSEVCLLPVISSPWSTCLPPDVHTDSSQIYPSRWDPGMFYVQCLRRTTSKYDKDASAYDSLLTMCTCDT